MDQANNNTKELKAKSEKELDEEINEILYSKSKY